MNPNSVCPRCGSLTANGVCTTCGVSSTLSSVSTTQPRKSHALKIWLIAITVYLACSAALLVYIGHLIVQKAKAREAWRRSHPALSQPMQQKTALHHDGPAARIDELKGSGRIYLIQMGDHTALYSVDDMAQWLHSKYSLDVQVLPPTKIDKSNWDSSRKQVVAELLYQQIKREHPNLVEDPKAVIIGITDLNMFSVSNGWSYSFTQRYESRYAIVSTYEGMRWYNWERNRKGGDRAGERFQARIRRILLRDVALIYWHLPRNNDSSSLLKDVLDPGTPTDDIYESDLDPARTSKGEYLDGPGIFLTYSAKTGLKPLPGASIQECCAMNPNLLDLDESREVIEVYLASGLLVDTHTDFNLHDTIPIQFHRVTRDGWSGKNPFGVSGTDSYDEFLGSQDNIHISVYRADSSRDNLVRVPIWLPILPLVKYVDTDYSGKLYEMRWHTAPFEHYELKRYDGEIKSYLPCLGSKYRCFLTGYRSAEGQELKFNRDASRKLTQLTSPNGSWLRLSYGPEDHIVEIDDSRGRTVRYGYNDRNQLTTVTYPSGEIYSYEYDNKQHLLTFSVAPDAKTPPRVLLRNEYENGRVVKQSLDNGTSYSYRYAVASSGSVTGVNVHTPEGREFNVEICDGYSSSTVREVSTQPANGASQPSSK